MTKKAKNSRFELLFWVSSGCSLDRWHTRSFLYRLSGADINRKPGEQDRTCDNAQIWECADLNVSTAVINRKYLECSGQNTAAKQCAKKQTEWRADQKQVQCLPIDQTPDLPRSCSHSPQRTAAGFCFRGMLLYVTDDLSCCFFSNEIAVFIV